jgi:methylated-DNA-[protein]-cysteine S-methyltransferase
MSGFSEKIYKIVKKIPKGKVSTYKKLAELAGQPRAWRAVGNVLNKSASRRTKIPCHRVVRSNGKIGGYNRGERNKIALLKREGLIMNYPAPLKAGRGIPSGKGLWAALIPAASCGVFPPPK